MILDYQPFSLIVANYNTVDGTAKSPEPKKGKAPDSGPVERARFYSLRESARIIRLDRGSTLRQAIADGLIKAVKVGAVNRISGEELARILQDGLPALPGGRRAPQCVKRRSPAKKARLSAGSIAKIPL
jgi:hypothetical protein